MFSATRHQREQRQVLEDQRGRPLVRADAVHVLAADPHRAFRRLDEAGDDAQDGGLAAARRPEEGEELAAFDVQRRVLDRRKVAEADRYSGQARHRRSSACSAPTPAPSLFSFYVRIEFPRKSG